MHTAPNRRMLYSLRRLAARQHFWATAKVVFLYSDTTHIRALSALGCFGWSAALFWPGATFDRHGYEWMAHMLPELAWATLFLFTGTAIMWFVFYPVEKQERAPLKRKIASVANAMGFLLWFSVASLMTLAIREFVPTMAVYWCLAAAQFVAFIRGGRDPYVAKL